MRAARGFGSSAERWFVLYALLGLVFVATTPRVVVADTAATKARTLTKLAEGVYEIRHKDAPNGFPNGNTTVIIGDRDVLVVDSCYLPSAAREDIAQIKQWTDKPVRYLFNTHWHADHTRGNDTYLTAFPTIKIISQTATAELVKGFYADHPENAIVVVNRGANAYRRYLETGKTEDGTPLTEDDKKEVKEVLGNIDSVLAEFKNLVPRVPDVTFDRELDIDLGNREVQLKFLGRGNTAGDGIVWLPKERILITGDLVVHPRPYTGSGFPSEWSAVLEKMIAMSPLIVVPGHGEVMHDTTYMAELAEVSKTIVAQVKDNYYRLTNVATLDDIKKAMDMAALLKRFDGYFHDDGQTSDASLELGGIIKVAYEEIQPR